jgi:hypothetical protein
VRVTGWIYDAYLEQDQIILWMKTDNSQLLQLTDPFLAELYAVPSTKHSAAELTDIISNHPLVESALLCLRYAEITDTNETEVVQIIVKPSKLRKAIWDLASSELCALYNTDLNPVQRYSCHRRLDWRGKFDICFKEDRRITEIKSITSDDVPPLDALEINPESAEDDEYESWLSANELLVVSREQRPHLYFTLRKAGILKNYTARPIPGKVILDSDTFRNLGIAGLDEKSRFAQLPIGVVAPWGPARTIDSRQSIEAWKKHILVPHTKTGTARNVLTAKEVAYTDRGALILSPKVGLHEHIAELDFESLFPSIIVKHNISYETVSAHGTNNSRTGLLAEIVAQFLQRRLAFKHKRDLVEKSAEWEAADKRDSLLKKLLVCLYGYSGSDLNRFGNMFAYREVNRIGRETVVAAMNIALSDGFEVIYLDTDSIFVKKNGANIEEFQALAERIRNETGYEITVANHYRYLVLLTQEADPEIEAARRFYGKLSNGKVYYRGIELRRHDYPVFLKRFQQQLLDTILEADTAADIMNRQLKVAMQLTQETVEKIQAGDLPLSELSITKILWMPVEEYRSLFPHVVAAVQLKQNGKSVKPGQAVDYLYVDTQHVNPMKRVAPAGFANNYDADKYTEMLLDVAESILGVFGFSRTQFGFQRRHRDFLEELRGERAKEIVMELESLEPNV